MARSKHIIAENIYQLRQDVAGICRAHGGLDPVRWLTTLMQGKDPRNIPATLSEMILRIARDDMDGERESSLPDESEWRDIVTEAAKEVYRYAPVSVDLSYKAAAELMKYLHKNLIELKNEIAVMATAPIKPFTRQEIEDAQSVFESRFG